MKRHGRGRKRNSTGPQTSNQDPALRRAAPRIPASLYLWHPVKISPRRCSRGCIIQRGRSYIVTSGKVFVSAVNHRHKLFSLGPNVAYRRSLERRDDRNLPVCSPAARIVFPRCDFNICCGPAVLFCIARSATALIFQLNFRRNGCVP